MKKANVTIIATIITAFGITMFAFQPTATEASSNIEPSANPTPRKIRAVPTSTREPIRKIRAKHPTNYQEGGGGSDLLVRRKPKRQRNAAQYNPKEVGIDKIKAKAPNSVLANDFYKVERRKHPRRKRNTKFIQSKSG